SLRSADTNNSILSRAFATPVRHRAGVPGNRPAWPLRARTGTPSCRPGRSGADGTGIPAAVRPRPATLAEPAPTAQGSALGAGAPPRSIKIPAIASVPDHPVVAT